MSKTREDEFIESWHDAPRDSLTDAELNQALSAFRALRSSTEGLENKSDVDLDQQRIEQQISQITQQIPSLDTHQSNVVSFPQRKRRWSTAIGAMAACLALALGLNLYMSSPQQSDDWGQHTIVRGETDVDTIEIFSTVSNPKKTASDFVDSLRKEQATYRLEKLSSSKYRVVFMLKKKPEQLLASQLSGFGVEQPAVDTWYVLTFAK